MKIPANFSAVTVKDLVSIAGIRNTFVAHEAPAADLFADMDAFVIPANTQLVAATAKLHASFVAGVKGRSSAVWHRPDIVIRIASKEIISRLTNFCVPIGEET